MLLNVRAGDSESLTCGFKLTHKWHETLIIFRFAQLLHKVLGFFFGELLTYEWKTIMPLVQVSRNDFGLVRSMEIKAHPSWSAAWTARFQGWCCPRSCRKASRFPQSHECHRCPWTPWPIWRWDRSRQRPWSSCPCPFGRQFRQWSSGWGSGCKLEEGRRYRRRRLCHHPWSRRRRMRIWSLSGEKANSLELIVKIENCP